MNNQFDFETQCELSYELLSLLGWLATHEVATLKKLVGRAIAHGFKYPSTHDKEAQSTSSLYYSIVDFLDILEKILHDTLNEETLRQAQQHNLLPTLHKIDMQLCDTSMMNASVEKSMDDGEEADARERLLKELLKQYKSKELN